MMTNQDIIESIEGILCEDNICDQIIARKVLEKGYKKSLFYKQTKMPLEKLILEYRISKFFNLDDLTILIQEKLNSLDLSNVAKLIDNFSKSIQTDIIDLNGT